MQGIKVNLNKQDGTLSLSNVLFSWIDSTSKAVIEFQISSIASLHVNASVPGSTKFLLKILLKNSSSDSIMLSFENETIRNIIKDHISKIMAKSITSTTPSHVFELRSKLLSENLILSTLYQELVDTKLISIDEFWLPFEKEIYLLSIQDTIKSSTFTSSLMSHPSTTKKLSLTPELIHCLLANSPKLRNIYDLYVINKKSVDEKTFWTLFFQNDHNIITDAFNTCILNDLSNKDINSDLQSLRDTALDFSMESLELQEYSNQSLISSVNRWSSILLPQFSSSSYPLCETNLIFNNEPLLAPLEIKALIDYMSKASKQNINQLTAEILENTWNLRTNFVPSSIIFPKRFNSLHEITKQMPSSDFLRSFLTVRKDVIFFHDKAIQVLKIYWNTSSPSEGLLKVIEQLLNLFRIMKTSFPDSINDLGSSLEESLAYVFVQNTLSQKRHKSTQC